MPQKIFDILPPTTFREEKPKPPLEKTIPSPLFAKKKWWGVLLILIFVGISCYFALPRAEIEIWPVTEIKTSETKVTINKDYNPPTARPDVLNKVIPGEIFEAEKTVSEEFPSSGKILKEEKAEGVIRLYNRYTTQPEVWWAGTRFISAEGGKIFKSKSKISVPGAKLEKGKLIPSYVDVEVIADEAGEDYNVGPTKFAVYVYRGTPKYTEYWGESFEPMTGGNIAEVPQVLQEDLDRAKKILEEKALNESKAAILEKISPEFILLEGAFGAEILETFSLARPKAELEKFIFQVKAKGAALVFKVKDLENFAKEFILSQTPESKRLYQESLKINYSPETIDLKSGKISLSLDMEAKIYSPLDEISLKKGLSGKSSAETKIFLENLPQISRAQIKLWPFWVKKVPEDLRKIEIKLRID